MNNTVLSVKNLNISYGEKEVIKDLSFDVKERENLIIMGPNGAGKTTLFKAILGLIPYSGDVIWKKDIKTGYLPSQESILRDKTLPITVKDFFALKNISEKDTLELLNDVDLSVGLLKKDIIELSTGQFQRMSIAWALSGSPDILFFDEPISGIDVMGRKTIYDLLHKFWKEKNLTILMITHDLSIVWEHANHVLCLGRKNSCYGVPRDILSQENLESVYGTGIKFYEHKHD